jgi:predicted dinucleotide-binding enzyme
MEAAASTEARHRLREEFFMKIGSIGKGNVGGALTRLWQQAGHNVRAGGREDSVADVAAHGDVVLLAVDAEAVEEVVQAAGPLDGKVLIDATNDIDAKFGSLAGRVAELAPGAKVVKAFNATFAPVFDAAAQLDPPANLVLCGDDEGAKETVSGLIRDIGMTPVDVGGLDQAANVEAFARMNISLAYGQGRGPQVYRFDAPNS